ncbi:MAG TPA: ATP-binding cassette domain-containing protein [Acidimicrobiales bacterium]
MAAHDDAPVSARGLTKRFGNQLAVDDLTFSIAPGRVTGFLGPNGAGKTTTLRMVVGLATPTSGDVLVFGTRYADLEDPTRTVGTLIDASGFHPGRRARHELEIRAAATGIDDGRVPEVLAEVGLEAAAEKRTGHLSLGMRQRLGLAAALLGAPRLLVLDEPANGLDPAGIHWLRQVLRGYAARGTAVLVSSHVLAELSLFADDVVVVNHGRLAVQSSVADLVAAGAERVVVRTPQAEALTEVLTAKGATVTPVDGELSVTGLGADTIGDLALAAAVPLHQLRTEIQTLEDVFLDLTDDDEAIR